MAKGIATFCIKGNKATRRPGKKVAAYGFFGFVREGLCGKESASRRMTRFWLLLPRQK